MSKPLDELAGRVISRAPARTVMGAVVAVTDSTHLLVDLGDRAVTAWLPPSLAGIAPVGAAVRVSVEPDNKHVIVSSDVAPVPRPYVVASGKVTLTFSGSASASAAITFPAAVTFTAAPLLLTALRNTSGLGIITSYTNLSTSGATITAHTGNGGAYTGSVSVGWYATQMTPTSDVG